MNDNAWHALAHVGKSHVAHTMSSREIADLTGSTHDNVLKTIRGVVGKGVVSANETPYIHPQNGQTYHEFLLGFRDTMVIVSGYSAELRARIIDRWQELESAAAAPALPDFTNPVAAARAWANALEAKQAVEAQLALAASSVEFVDRYVAADGLKSFRQVAKLLNAKEHAFRKFLVNREIMYPLGGAWTAYQRHIDAGRFAVRTGEANGHAYTRSLFTPKGVKWITALWAAHCSQAVQRMGDA
jgi:phage antirepressor YoqD-like protein